MNATEQRSHRFRREHEDQSASLSQPILGVLTLLVLGIRPENLDVRGDQWTTCEPAMGGGRRTMLTIGS